MDWNWDQVFPIIMEWGWNIAKGLLILALGWLAGKWACHIVVKIFRRKGIDEALGKFLGAMIQYGVLAAAAIATLGVVGIETTGFLAIFASAGLAVGLALQGSLSNFASGVMLLFFRPFALDDKVAVAGHKGKVTDIGIFTTKLLTPDNETVIIPNRSVWGSSIVNYTAEPRLRGAVEVGVAYGSDVDQVTEILLAAAGKPEMVLQDPAPSVAFVGLGASSLDFKVLVWAESRDLFKMLIQVRQAVYEALNRAEIDIPFNQIVVHQAS